MVRAPLVLLPLLAAACCDVAPAHHARAAVPIKSACTAGSRSPSSIGLDVRPGRRHSDARTLFATNSGDRARTVRVQQVARLEGACDGDWSRQMSLDFIDVATCKAPLETTVPPTQWIELQIGGQRVASSWSCTKLGLALWLEVDDETFCADAGAWIAQQDADE